MDLTRMKDENVYVINIPQNSLFFPYLNQPRWGSFIQYVRKFTRGSNISKEWHAVRQKLITFTSATFNICTTLMYFAYYTKFFNQYNIYLYTTGTVFCQHVLLFCPKLNILSQHEPLFWLSHNIFRTHIILVRNVTSM